MIDFIKRNRVKAVIAVVSVVILTAAFVFGGGSQTPPPEPTEAAQEQAVRTEEPVTETAKPTELPTETPSPEPTAKPTAKPTVAPTAKPTVVPTSRPIAKPTAKPTPVPVARSAETEKASTVCTFSIRCDAAVGNPDLAPEKAAIVPEDGIIYAAREVEYTEGESVFDVLVRELKKNGIHIEYEYTPVYDSVYVEGIANLYEFDCGGLSGWRYKVNGKYPNYGCSSYTLKNGDKIEWVYSLGI